MKTNRLVWLDFLKGIAIIAVVIDHLYGILYKNILIQQHTSFSVNLFVFLAGISAAISLSRNNFFQFYKKRLLTLIIPYIIATAIASFIFKKPFFSSLIHFNAAGPYYFIVFFLQLLFIAPFLNKLNYYFIPLIFITSLLLNRFHFINLWGGGEFLFGGSFLFLYYLGILFYHNIHLFKPKLFFSFLTVIFLVIFEIFHLVPATWHNPPLFISMIYTLTIFFLFYNLSLNPKNPIVKIFSFLGRHSLYIFLYHAILISLLAKIFSIT